MIFQPEEYDAAKEARKARSRTISENESSAMASRDDYQRSGGGGSGVRRRERRASEGDRDPNVKDYHPHQHTRVRNSSGGHSFSRVSLDH